ncbi:MAG: hypothetical protein ACLFNK_02045, partial [Candidatus Woesearchaeota archaeon]
KDTVQQSPVSHDTVRESSDETIFIDYSRRENAVGESQGDSACDLSDKIENETRGDVHMKENSIGFSDSSSSAGDESSLEDSSFFAELRDEEQTSLISGYMSSEKEDFFSNASDESKDASESIVSDENIFKDSEYKKEDTRGSYMYERTSNHEIRSRFPVEFDNDEDFFTPTFQSSERDQGEEASQPSREAQSTQTGTPQTVQASQASQSHSQSDSRPAEADVDITTMFNFGNRNG